MCLEKLTMATTRITIPLDPETAKAYRGADAADKKKMLTLVRLWLRDLASEEPATLDHLLDEVSDKAVQRGLTPKILDALLKGA
jgi:hypothetical protein